MSQPEIYELFCAIPNEDLSFLVTIAETETIGRLKQLIKEERRNTFADIDAGSLTLYHVESADSNHLAANIKAQTRDSALSFSDRMVEIFQGTPKEHTVHIIVCPPYYATAARLKSHQSNEPILNGRPFTTAGPSITIYEPVFSSFRAMNEGKVPLKISAEDYMHVKDFLLASANIHLDGKHRKAAVDGPLNLLLGRVLRTVTLTDGTSNGGVIEVDVGDKIGLLLLREIKNEVGSGNCDPSVQACFSFSRWWSDRLGCYFRDRSRCPSFILSIAGPWICVQGGILIDESWTVQLLTDFVWAGGTTDMNAQAVRIARLLCSLKVALGILAGQFEALVNAAPLSPALRFPSLNSYVDDDTLRPTTFTYKQRLHYQRGGEANAIFSAELDGGERIFIKFTAQYNVLAHRILAKEGYAPHLRHFSQIPSGCTHFMVVMDHIDGEDMGGKGFTEEDLSRIRKAKETLHRSDYVFGDLRPPNILKPRDGSGVILVDFDWCGRDGVDIYPPMLNDDPGCKWHPEVEGGGIMRKSHDDHLLNTFRRA